MTGLDGFDVEYVSITPTFTHTDLPDLTIDITSPEGTTVNLINNDTNDFMVTTLANSGWSWDYGAHSFRGEDLR